MRHAGGKRRTSLARRDPGPDQWTDVLRSWRGRRLHFPGDERAAELVECGVFPGLCPGRPGVRLRAESHRAGPGDRSDGTVRHVIQGALELEDLSWNADAKTLSGVSLGPERTAHNISVYIPEAQPWFQGGPFLFHDFDGYTVKMMDDHMLRIRVRFDTSSRVPWRINTADFLKRRQNG